MQQVLRFITKVLLMAVLILTAGCATLLVTEQSQLSKVGFNGHSRSLFGDPGPARVMRTEIFVLRNQQVVVSDKFGNECRRISVPKEVLYANEFVVIPDGRLAFLDNRNDAIYFINAKGEHLKTVAFNDKPDDHWQNMDGVVVGSRLVISENGHNQLIAVDLSTYQVSIFRDLKDLRGWLGAITYADGEYYLCQSKAIYTFSENSEGIKKIASTPEGNITGIAHAQGRLFVVVNGMSNIKERSLAAKYRTTQGVLYEINRKTGEAKIVKDGLNYPDSVLVIQ
ncbi:MAG: hypothetical protein KAR47_10665 [Planctomycetes bacterium]|nr:hypothetical protein [Planctomycetota bacterium]